LHQTKTLHSSDEISPVTTTIQSEVVDKTLSSSQFLESREPHKGPSIKEMKDFICSWFGNSFDKPVHSFYSCNCEGS